MSSNHFISAESLREPHSDAQHVNPSGPASMCDSGEEAREPVLLGESVAVRRLRSQIQRIAPYYRTALIRGETGSGKELVARAIHTRSPGADGPFIVTDAPELAESIEASRPGSMRASASLLECAHGGTLYLKGVGELSYALQAALLRFIRACEERRSGTGSIGRVDFNRASPHGTGVRGRAEAYKPMQFPAPQIAATRILAASGRDLSTLSAIGQFRQDLYARLSAVEIVVPPLQQRVEDLPMLAMWLLRRLGREAGESAKLLAEATLAQLQEYRWPGNLRELERVMAQAAALAEGTHIEPRHLLALVESPFGKLGGGSTARVERLHDVMQRHLLEVLDRCGGNKLRAAELLGISRSTLYRMLDAGAARPLLK
jgi:DNA-binding NtrC family response regulator